MGCKSRWRKKPRVRKGKGGEQGQVKTKESRTGNDRSGRGVNRSFFSQCTMEWIRGTGEEGKRAGESARVSVDDTSNFLSLTTRWYICFVCFSFSSTSFVSIEENAEREKMNAYFVSLHKKESLGRSGRKGGESKMSGISRAVAEEVAAVAEGERPSEVREVPSLRGDRLPRDSGKQIEDEG